MRQEILLLGDVRNIAAQVHHAAQLRARQRLAPDRFQHFRRLPCGNRTICRAAVGVNSPHASSYFRLRSQALDPRQPPAHPNSCGVQQFRTVHLAQAVFAPRTSACMIQASLQFRVRPPARFSP